MRAGKVLAKTRIFVVLCVPLLLWRKSARKFILGGVCFLARCAVCHSGWNFSWDAVSATAPLPSSTAHDGNATYHLVHHGFVAIGLIESAQEKSQTDSDTTCISCPKKQ